VRLVGALTLAVGMLALLSPPTGATGGGVLVDRVGDWDLSRLGAPDLDPLVTPEQTESSAPFRLPPGSTQGPRRWYLIHMHIVPEVSLQSGSGLLSVIGSTDDHAAAEATIRVSARPGKPPLLRWSTFDLVNGSRKGTAHGERLDLDTQNYLQNRGVRGGANTLTFAVKSYGHVKVTRISVVRDSGIRVSNLSPPHLKLDASIPMRQVHTGDTFCLPYRLTDDGDRAAVRGAIGLQSLSGVLKVVGRRSRKFRRLAGGKNLTGCFHVHALRAGKARIDVSAGAENANHPAVSIAGRVSAASAPAQSSHSSPLASPLVVAIAAATGGSLWFRSRRRVQRRSPTDS
jgi:hypothetical protein